MRLGAATNLGIAASGVRNVCIDMEEWPFRAA